MRVLLWILDRCAGKVGANECAIGYIPNAEDIDITDLDMTMDQLKDILTIDNSEWIKDIEDPETGIKKYFAQFGDRLPQALADELTKLENNLKN